MAKRTTSSFFTSEQICRDLLQQAIDDGVVIISQKGFEWTTEARSAQDLTAGDLMGMANKLESELNNESQRREGLQHRKPALPVEEQRRLHGLAKTYSLTGVEVCEWPEFQAFMNRLGAGVNLETTEIVITIPCNDQVTVRETFHAKDVKKEDSDG